VVDLHAVAESRLRADGQRYTRNRRAIVEALHQADRPLSLPQLIRHRRDLAQSSAYRNLAILEAAGLVHRIVTGDDSHQLDLLGVCVNCA
jgi:Fur family ferric uptake transcriptional regulator